MTNILLWQLWQTFRKREFWANLFAPLGVGLSGYQIVDALNYEQYLERYLPLWWTLLAIGGILAFGFCWQRRSVSASIPALDTEIFVKVGDIFSSKSPVVIPIPTTLETTFENDRISKHSLQGQFTLRYFGDPNALSAAIDGAVKRLPPANSAGSTGAESPIEFEFGEVLVVRSGERTGYLVAFARFNSHGTAQLSVEEFRRCLPRMWLGIKERGEIGAVDIPLMGSGHARLDLSRKSILREILKSYAAACTEGRIADRVTVYVRPEDFRKWGFDLHSIKRLLDTICEDHPGVASSREKVGRSLD